MIHFKRLLNLFLGCEMSDITGNLLNSGTECRQGICDSEIDFSRIGLGGDAITLGKTSFLAQQLIEFVL